MTPSPPAPRCQCGHPITDHAATCRWCHCTDYRPVNRKETP